jgi:energy-coupling factor transporter transmembrane protein EcfT
VALECERGTCAARGAAALSGVVWALLIPGNRIKFLIHAEILGLSALWFVIGAAFIHTRNSHLFQSPPYRVGRNLALYQARRGTAGLSFSWSSLPK